MKATMSSWLIIVIGNLTVAVEYMPMDEVAFMPKSIYLSVCLVLYLLTSFVLGRFNLPEYRYSKLYIVGRLAVCVFIVLVGVATSFDPATGLGCHVFAVYAAFAYEWVLWHRRTRLAEYGRALGMSCEQMAEEGYDIHTMEGRLKIERSARESARDGNKG